MLSIVATDATFARAEVRGVRAWVGRCLHCNTKLVVSEAGETSATIEHIEPRHHGGTDAPENLALACARCNAGKGMRLDHRKKDDPKLREVVEALRAKRLARFREGP